MTWSCLAAQHGAAGNAQMAALHHACRVPSALFDRIRTCSYGERPAQQAPALPRAAGAATLSAAAERGCSGAHTASATGSPAACRRARAAASSARAELRQAHSRAAVPASTQVRLDMLTRQVRPQGSRHRRQHGAPSGRHVAHLAAPPRRGARCTWPASPARLPAPPPPPPPPARRAHRPARPSSTRGRSPGAPVVAACRRATHASFRHKKSAATVAPVHSTAGMLHAACSQSCG